MTSGAVIVFAGLLAPAAGSAVVCRKSGLALPVLLSWTGGGPISYAVPIREWRTAGPSDGWLALWVSTIRSGWVRPGGPRQGLKGVALEGKIETVGVEVKLLRTDLRKVADKVKVAEGSIVELQTEVGVLWKQMAQANTAVRQLEVRLGDAEQTRLLGFPKRAEGSTAETFVENWIRDILQPTRVSRVFVVERAHRALVAPPRPNVPKRAIIASLLNYKGQDCVLRAARESDRAVFENCKISIYPDYTNKVQSSRKGFLEVKAKLRAMNIRYMLLYPARLKVLSGGKSHFFKRPEEEWRWLEIWDKVTPGRTDRTEWASPRTSGLDGPDWRSHDDGQLKNTVARGWAKDSTHRVEIQQDGTMAIVTAGSAKGLNGELEPGAERVSTQL
ncbi:hypothetical protein NDU88_001777 [Pleurodeles waltl]|uniref:Uncharacterized protein n=1 Tax=Pleurodeles waltl TaxID=8319 RepID=A0AAV7UTQ3_PLEWA|nr:hypothetical protein NDU88_001777 [Pleurodeles waltl]